MNLEIIQADITEMRVDAIVNAANNSLLGGGGVDGAIHRKGGATILEECIKIRNKQGGCPTGEAVVTSAGKLPAKFVIHTVGPVWNQGKQEEALLLESCYKNCLLLAEKLQVQSIAFPNISTGIYGFPKDLAAEIALKTIKDFSAQFKYIQAVIFVCFDQENFNIYSKLTANS